MKPAGRQKTGKGAKGANKRRAKRPARAAQALWLGAEAMALAAAALIATLALIGHAAQWIAGVGLWSSLIPFAALVLALAGLGWAALGLWLRIRKPLAGRAKPLPLALALAVGAGSGGLASGEGFQDALERLRGLVGGTRQAERIALSHQVYAAYRRADLSQMRLLLERAQAYEAPIQEAASAQGVDAAVLTGIAATESSFLPRDSKDGGRGLFQLTAPPKAVLDQVGKQLGKPLDWRNPRHNALIAAATWRHYLRQMQDDLFLGLLAYNIGPKNGGLLSIMRQYGAKDFATIQPYLQNLPRDYPIRVLTAALAFRLWKLEGRLPRYEEGDNAKRIQAIGIPGLVEHG